MKKILSVSLAVLLLLLTLVACGTKPGETETETSGEPEHFGYADDFSYYKPLVMNKEKHLYVYNRSERLSDEETVLAEAIQGLGVISCSAQVDTNIVMLHIPAGRAEELQQRLLAHGVVAGAVDEARVRLVFHLGISEEDTAKTIQILKTVDCEMAQ